MEDFWHMGGYALYVWPSFLIAALIMLTMVCMSLVSLRKARRSLASVSHQSPQQGNEA